ncbi:MAG TPA: vWA domain-containing protein [Tepidisphaeraceae bacterium]
MSWIAFTLDRPGLFAVGCALAVVAAWVAAARRPAIGAITGACFGVALVLLALAAGGLVWHRPTTDAESVAVMVDLSASTRGAAYRDPARLDARVHQLIGRTPYRVVYFAERNTPTAPGGGMLADLPGDRTVFAPPAAPAVVLFSDGRFELPAFAPPTFVVADPELDQPADAAVARLEARGEDLAVTVANTGGPRRLALDGVSPVAIEPSAGPVTLTRKSKTGAAVATAQLDKGDRWPENDSLSLPIAPPVLRQRWFVSSRDAPGGQWVSMRPGALPTDPAAYLAPAVIVLDNLSSADLSAAQQRLLEQYVRDLGGALVISGGDRAFAQGLYTGTALEALSPLASAPPAPAVHWVLLADASGSMSQAAGDAAAATRWQVAASAITRLLPSLPGEDPVTVGSFSAEVNWWSTGRSARETLALSLPPPTVAPNGPTNLAAALARVAREADGSLPTELLVVSDADVTIDQPELLASQLKAKKIRLHVLAIGDGRGLDALGRITAATGGTLRRQLDPRQWAAEVRRLLTSASPKRLIETPVTVRFEGELSALSGRAAVSPWNRTWLKKSASELARTQFGGEAVSLAARWSVGAEGTVIACGFAPDAAELEAMAKLAARPPRDPRFKVTWETAGPRLGVRVDAADAGGRYLNDLRLRLAISGEEDGSAAPPVVHEIPQTAPGRYELTLPPGPRARSFATLREGAGGGRVIDRVAVAGRYAPEFDAIGNDYDAMHALAHRTGGAVIDRAWTKPIDLPLPRREVDLTAWLALAGALALAAGLARWRLG